jgi:hypothetical protein
VASLRTICPLSNLSSLKHLRVLHHPYLFNTFTRGSSGSTDSTQVTEVRTLLERDQLEEFQFEMKYSGIADYAKLLGPLKTAQRLKKLIVTVSLKGDLIETLNKNIGKDANIKSLAIYFANYQQQQPGIQ